MVAAQFVDAVRSGRKKRTIRPCPKVPIFPGDTLDLRTWTGAPYRSKQARICEVVVEKIEGVIIHARGIELCPGRIRGIFRVWANAFCERFARADGFASADEMRAWFAARYAFPFAGQVIYWLYK